MDINTEDTLKPDYNAILYINKLAYNDYLFSPGLIDKLSINV